MSAKPLDELRAAGGRGLETRRVAFVAAARMRRWEREKGLRTLA